MLGRPLGGLAWVVLVGAGSGVACSALNDPEEPVNLMIRRNGIQSGDVASAISDEDKTLEAAKNEFADGPWRHRSNVHRLRSSPDGSRIASGRRVSCPLSLLITRS